MVWGKMEVYDLNIIPLHRGQSDGDDQEIMQFTKGAG